MLLRFDIMLVRPSLFSGRFESLQFGIGTLVRNVNMLTKDFIVTSDMEA